MSKEGDKWTKVKGRKGKKSNDTSSDEQVKLKPQKKQWKPQQNQQKPQQYQQKPQQSQSHARPNSKQDLHDRCKFYRQRHISKEDFLQFVRKDCIELVQNLHNQIKPFQASLEISSFCAKEMNLILRVLMKVSEGLSLEGEVKSNAIIILSEIFSTRCPVFQSQLKMYVTQMVMKRTYKERELILVCDFFLELLKVIPGSCWTILPIDELSATISMLSAGKLLQESSIIESKHKSLLEIRDSMKEQQRVESINISKSAYADLKTWNNSEYRTLQILPQWLEVSDPKPPWKLRPNVIHGEYEDWMHYYDVQFRLLREDFIAPLRKGIKDYRDGKVGREVSNVRVYHGVVIKGPLFTKAGLCHEIHFSTERFQRTNWEHSKRLIFGSLLCLSPDNFQCKVLFATVSNRDPKELKNGRLQVLFQDGAEVIMHQKLRTQFVMVESIAFYEASCHILRSLQRAEDSTMPFTKYIIKNETESVGHPKYLEVCSKRATYNMSSIIKEDILKNPKLVATYSQVDIRNSLEWPPLEDTGLDESQLKALKMALTQEVAVIQGPPGTGKTYIGFKIVQALLKNSDFWSTQKSDHAQHKRISGGPILVMCFTNHALDQFLEGVMDHTDENEVRLIRIGGRCKNEKIQACSLYNAMMDRKIVPWGEHLSFMERARAAEGIGKECKDELTRYYDPVHNFFVFSDIKHVISEHHIQSLRDCANSPEEQRLALELWLGLYVKKEYTVFDPIELMEDNFEEVSSSDSSDTESDDYDDDDEYETASSNFGESDEESSSSEEDTAIVIGDADREQEARLIEGMEDMYKEIDLEKVVVVKAKKPKRTHNIRRIVKVEKCQNYLTYLRSITKNLTVTRFTEFEAEDIEDLHQLHLDDRWQLYKYWHSKYRERLLEQLEEKCQNYNEACEAANDAKRNKERHALERAHIIGMTTTGAAKYQHVLHMVKPKIVIVEEAAEVLESHIVSALNAGTQHLILIGDHKQLRPKPNEYDLAKKYKLDVSLFERLVINNFPHVTLENQHRMRPEIAELVHPHIYDTLYNHESVQNYPKVEGVCKNMFFISHTQLEQPSSDLSHANEFEANYLIALCQYLFQQGYLPTRITILVTYTGQLLLMKNVTKLKDKCRGVRICTVDNFQGEENDIILLSLVRSNKEGKIGFLSEDNRVCVSLSRAKHGFYCIGNFTMLRRKSDTWQGIMSDMEAKDKLGNGLEIHCTNHPDNKSVARSPDDFAKISPKGGCNLDCGKRLKCGHTCPQKCHMEDPNHSMFSCKKPCGRTCPMNHQCTDYCFKACKCKEKVEKEFLKCGHKKSVYCYEDIKVYQCDQKVPKSIPRCGHTQLVPCSMNPKSFQCLEDVEQTIPKCNHKHVMKCHQNPVRVKCSTLVTKTLPICGHTQEMCCYLNSAYAICESQCGKFCSRTLHQCSLPCHKQEPCPPCTVLIEETLKCGHEQEIYCYKDVNSVKCFSMCEKTCEFNHQCQLKCYQKCQPCRVYREINPACGHLRSVFCFETTRYVCTKQVDKKLDCGHIKPLPCSEDPKSVKCSILVAMTLRKCGHTLEVQCSRSDDVAQIICDKLVNKRLNCGLHYKEVKCSVNIDSIKCFEKVPVSLKCGHQHILSCHIDPSSVKCDKICSKTLTCLHKKRVCCFETPSSDDCVEPCFKTLPSCGHEVKVVCNKNPDTVICNKACKKTLECDHDCQMICGAKCACHRVVDVDLPCGHSASVTCQQSKSMSDFKCIQSCKEILRCDHMCKKMCYEPCTKDCIEKITDTCKQGHVRIIPCFKKSILGPCMKKCEKKLQCQHSCKKLCSSPCTTKCRFAVVKKYPCGHSHKIPCSAPPEAFPCDIDCKHPLSCGHLCNGKCSDCYTTRIHKACTSTNSLKHFCGEKTRLPCLGLKSKHTKAVTGKYLGQVVQCKHTKVPWKCSNKLPECRERCGWSCTPECPHPQRCTKACYELCNRYPCNERCPKMLKCKHHRCMGLCGEPCINTCPICDPDRFLNLLKMSPTYSDKQVYIQLPCDHIFTVADMDSHVHPKPECEVGPLQCPACFTPLSCSYRYGNAMKKSLHDIDAVKRIMETRRRSKDFLLRMYSDAKKELQKPQIREVCPPQLYQTVLIAMKKVCQTEPSQEEEFMLYLIVKLIHFIGKHTLSDVALDIIENLRAWLRNHLDSPKLSFQVAYDLLSEYYRLCLEVMTVGHPKSIIGSKHFDRLKKDPFSRISSKEFEQYSQKIDERVATSILTEVNRFQPMIKNGTWRKCNEGHFYCVPATRSDFQYLKVQCFQCNGGSYFASIVLELPSDARSISQRYIDISREREKAIVNEEKMKWDRATKGMTKSAPDTSGKTKTRRKKRKTTKH